MAIKGGMMKFDQEKQGLFLNGVKPGSGDSRAGPEVIPLRHRPEADTASSSITSFLKTRHSRLF